jgi:hypothetical protein
MLAMEGILELVLQHQTLPKMNHVNKNSIVEERV